MAATEVKGGGRQKGIALQWRAGDYRVEFIPKMKLEVVVDDQDVEAVIDLICDTVQTWEAGDGKIFVYPVEDVIRVRAKAGGTRRSEVQLSLLFPLIIILNISH
jgi:nitrogen regulatory protein P-II 1